MTFLLNNNMLKLNITTTLDIFKYKSITNI